MPSTTKTILLHRPVSPACVANALGLKPFEIMGRLIDLQIFVAPSGELSDEELGRLGNHIGVNFQFPAASHPDHSPN